MWLQLEESGGASTDGQAGSWQPDHEGVVLLLQQALAGLGSMNCYQNAYVVSFVMWEGSEGWFRYFKGRFLRVEV